MDTGTLIGARYRLDRRLAAGGMGVVWVAHDELLGRPVALKVLHQSVADEDRRRRFRAEARAAARLSHPGVVAVYDYGEDADVTYLAMELVDGESLHEVLRRRGSLSPDETMQIVAQAASALADAHAHGLVHRDIKPANLLVAPNGTVKVTDFGIARAVDMTTATLDGSVLGTVAYMSPEQIRGERVGAASDVYSLGVVAYEALAGVRPFPAEESITVALSHLHDPVPPLPGGIPVPVAALVQSMLGKEPEVRPPAGRVAGQAGRLAVDPGPIGPATMPQPPVLAASMAVGMPSTQPAERFPTAGRFPAAGRPADPAAAVGESTDLTVPGSVAPDPTVAATTRPAPLRTLGAALGAAALSAKLPGSPRNRAGRAGVRTPWGRSSRQRPSASVVSGVVLAALALGLVLAAVLPGSGSPGKALAATRRVATGSGPVTDPRVRTRAPSPTTTTTTTTSPPSTAPVVVTTDTQTPPRRRHHDGTDQGGPGQSGPGPGGPVGHGGQQHGDPGDGGGPGPGGPGGGGAGALGSH